MITVVVFLVVCSGIVSLIDWNSNRNYDSLVRLRSISIASRVQGMNPRDINMLLEHTGKYIEMADRLVEGNKLTKDLTGFMSHRMVFRALVNELGGVA